MMAVITNTTLGDWPVYAVRGAQVIRGRVNHGEGSRQEQLDLGEAQHRTQRGAQGGLCAQSGLRTVTFARGAAYSVASSWILNFMWHRVQTVAGGTRVILDLSPAALA